MMSFKTNKKTCNTSIILQKEDVFPSKHRNEKKIFTVCEVYYNYYYEILHRILLICNECAIFFSVVDFEMLYFIKILGYVDRVFRYRTGKL